MHSLRAQSHMRNDCEDKIAADRVFTVYWSVRGCCCGAGVNDLDFILLHTRDDLKFSGVLKKRKLENTDFWMINSAKILQIKSFPSNL